MVIHKYPNSEFDLNVADFIFEQWEKLSNEKEKVFIALSGGTTPLPILEILSTRKLPWEKFHFFIVDERVVPSDHPDSNYGNINEAFFKRVNATNFPMVHDVHHIERDAQAYEGIIRKTLNTNQKGIPAFDQILLGMGNDGHTASLFDGTKAIDENEKLVTANYVEKLKSHRLTFTFELLNNSNSNLLIFKGDEKLNVFMDRSHELPVSKLKIDFVLTNQN